MELSLQEFMDSVSNRNTKKEYRHGIKKFCEWFGKGAEEILELRKDDLTQRPIREPYRLLAEGVNYRNSNSRSEADINMVLTSVFHIVCLFAGHIHLSVLVEEFCQ